jgi:hypothetical protein
MYALSPSVLAAGSASLSQTMHPLSFPRPLATAGTWQMPDLHYLTALSARSTIQGGIDMRCDTMRAGGVAKHCRGG